MFLTMNRIALAALAISVIAFSGASSAGAHDWKTAGETFKCSKCGWETTKQAGDDERLDGFYERIKAHGETCFLKSDAELRKMVKDWNRRQEELKARNKTWKERAKSWEKRVDLYDKARGTQEKNIKKWNEDREDLNRRIEKFNKDYANRKLDESTYNYAAGLKRNLAAEDTRLNTRKDDLIMVQKGLDKVRAELERELSELKTDMDKLKGQQDGLDKERAMMEKMGIKFETEKP